MSFILPPLPYAIDALAPVISSETLNLHHGKHHKAYVDKLNELVADTRFEKFSLERIIKESEGDIFNQAAQAWNHEFYWCGLVPAKDCQPIDQWPKLKTAIDKDFGSVHAFIDEFNNTAISLFGSGWVWLVQDPKTKRLSIRGTSNAENPLRKGLMPLWTCDVWEHAYYVDYRNERKKYMEHIWDIANWKHAADTLLS